MSSFSWGLINTAAKKKEERERALEEMGKTWGREAMKDTTLDYPHEKQIQQRLAQQAAMRAKQQKQKGGAELDMDDFRK